MIALCIILGLLIFAGTSWGLMYQRSLRKAAEESVGVGEEEEVGGREGGREGREGGEGEKEGGSEGRGSHCVHATTIINTKPIFPSFFHSLPPFLPPL